ncbi:MAG: transferase [Desulfobacterales bacterium]|jgi:carbonic anhydrase/acetyltransferase-like protein (isoleucine patch superfamily)|nr:transferase [Desulfobacterales bacterium]
MKNLEKLLDRIINQLNINLRRLDFDAKPHLKERLPLTQLLKFYAFYGISSQHPIHFHFSNSNLAGSYFLGQCKVDNSILYKSDIRGDELKAKGGTYTYQGKALTVEEDEFIWIKGSYLLKTLVHSYSHDPEKLELYLIKNSAANSYSNIHGSPMEGCFLNAFATVDLTSLYDCVVGRFAYVQTGALEHEWVPDGQIWIRNPEAFDFKYRHSVDVLDRYISFAPGNPAKGIFIDFVEDREDEFQQLFEVVHRKVPIPVPTGASLNRYAVIRGDTTISENVLVAQRAYLDNSWLGKGANAQEHCYIIHSFLKGYVVMAHGAKVIYTLLDTKVFVGFNSFLRGNLGCPLSIGAGSIVIPHTIIDLEEPLTIPANHMVWGYIRNSRDLENNSISLEKLSQIDGELQVGEMTFQGNGELFVKAFKSRIEHILTDNGAYFDGRKNRGHAQKAQNISYNIIQPYAVGPSRGLYPTIDIYP